MIEKSVITIRTNIKFYIELYDTEQNTIIHTEPNYVQQVTLWKEEAALRDIKNGTATGNDNTNRYIERRRRYNCTLMFNRKIYTPSLGER